MKVYAFDVDETLACAGGPIPFISLSQLHQSGAVVGLCGNWAAVVAKVTNWQAVVNFLGPLSMTKAEFLRHLAQYIPADEYVMVGNDPAVFGQSQDKQAADQAGWRFIREADFTAGVT